MDKVEFILDELKKIFPEAKCELKHENNFELICAVCLSAQTTDERVNMATPSLFERYPTCYDLKDANLYDLENIIKSIGLYHNKAINLIKMSKMLCDEFDGVVPNNMRDLVKLPGVGRKTANVVLSVGFDIPAFAVDTHVSRVSKRLGLVKKEDDVLAVETKLKRKIPKNEWNNTHHLFIFFGRYLCKAQKPECEKCPFISICKK